MEKNLYKFFIICPLNFEDTSIFEFKEKMHLHFPNQVFNILKTSGGFEVELPLKAGLYLNKILRTPVRILLRIDEFKCRDIPKLFLKTSKINWANYLLAPEVELEVSATESRLFDDRKISKAIQDGISKFFDSNPRKKKFIELFEKSNHKAKIYTRFYKDTCTLSIDTSGELLYKRNEKMLTGLAPIRENLATILILELLEDIQPSDINLIDPMCGSGTFLIEALKLNKLSGNREFNYNFIPLYLNDKEILKLEDHNLLNISAHGFEINDEVIKLTNENISDLPIKIIKADAFKNQHQINGKNIIILNPPYGIRVKAETEINQKYFKDLLKSLTDNFKPIKLGIIIPSQYNSIELKSYQISKRIKFKNGGIPVIYYVYTQKVYTQHS